MDAAGNASGRTIDMPRPAAFGGVRLSSRYSSDTGGAMLLTNANRDRPYSSSKLPKRAGQVFYGKKTTFTESVFADRIDFRPKVHPSKDALKKRLKAVKAEIRHEREMRKAVTTARKELEAKLDAHIDSQKTMMRTMSSSWRSGSRPTTRGGDGEFNPDLGRTQPAPKGKRNGQPYYGRVWCEENRAQEVNRLRPVRKMDVDCMFTVLHKT